MIWKKISDPLWERLPSGVYGWTIKVEWWHMPGWLRMALEEADPSTKAFGKDLNEENIHFIIKEHNQR